MLSERLSVDVCVRRAPSDPSEVSKPRRFPLPQSVEEQLVCFVVHDHNGQALAYVHFEEEPGLTNAA